MRFYHGHVTQTEGPLWRRVGAVATTTGLTVRALHYYEEIGLLVPSGRSAAGHRLYGAGDRGRLTRILLLRRPGLSLAAVGQALGDPDWGLPPSRPGSWKRSSGSWRVASACGCGSRAPSPRQATRRTRPPTPSQIFRGC